MKQKLILILSFSLSLLNAMEMEQSFSTDIAHHLCLYGTKSLNDAGQLISAFTQANRTLEKSFNDSSTCLFIIKKLSTRFACSNETVAEALSIKSARKRLYLQKTFQSYCKRFAHPYNDDNKVLKQRFQKLKQDNVDFNFSYAHNCDTGIMIALNPSNPEPSIAKYLILNGADLHIEDTNGFSAHSIVFRSHPYLIPFLLKHKKIEPNKKNGSRALTPLINLMMQLIYDCNSEHDIENIKQGMKILLDKGADPELKSKDNYSPLLLACKKQDRYPQFAEILEQAIAKKNATQ